MKRYFQQIIAIAFVLMAIITAEAQTNSVSIGTTNTNTSAVLWLNGDGKQGLIIPVGNRANVASPVQGMIIYDGTQIYYYDGANWNPIGGSGGGSGPVLSATQVLTGNGTTNTGVVLSGDATINAGVLKVIGIQGKGISSTAPTANQVLQFNGTSWVPVTLPGASFGNLTTTTSGLTVTGGTGAVSGAGTTINIQNATTSQPGLLTSADWNTFNGKVSLAGDLGGTATAPTISKIQGSTWPANASGVLTNNGSGTLAWSPVSGTGTVTNVTGTAPITVINNSTTPTISMSQANGTTNGFLASADWTSFNNKVSLAGDLSGTAAAPVVSKIQGVSVSSTAPTNSQVLQYNGTTWIPATLPGASFGNLTTTTTGLTITGGTGAVAGAGATVNIQNATTSQPGLLTAADWNTFNNKVNLAGDFGGTSAAPTVAKLGGQAYTFPASNAVSGVLTNSGAGTLTWAPVSGFLTTTLPSGNIFVGNASNVATATAMSGDATLSNTGLLTIGTGKVTSTAILDGTIANADIAAAAAIADTKLATISTAGKVSGNAITSGTIGGTTIINTSGDISTTGAGKLTVGGTTTFNGKTYTWPAAITAGTFLQTDASGNLAWVTLSGGGNMSTSTYDINADGIVDQAAALTTTLPIATGGTGLTSVPANGQVLIGNGAGYTLATLTGGSGINVTNSAGGITIASTGLSSTLNSANIYVGNASNVATGVAMSGDATISNTGALTIGSGKVNSAKILDGTIADADIAAAAAIVDTKLATISTAGKVSGSAITSGTIGGTTIINTSGDISTTGTGKLSVGGTTTFGTKTYTWPSTALTANTFLSTDATGNLSWVTTPSPFSTNNIIPKGNGTGLTSSLLNDNGSGIGIGTASPSTEFEIDASQPTIRLKSSTASTLSQSYVEFGHDDGSGGFTKVGHIGDTGSGDNLYLFSPNSILFNSNFADRFAIGTSGELGVGSPVSFGTSGQVLTSGGSGATAKWTSLPTTFSTLNSVPRGDGTTLVASSITDDGTKVGITNPTNVNSILTANLVGVNTSPLYKLDVNGDTRLQGFVGIGTVPSTSYNLDVGGGIRTGGYYYFNATSSVTGSDQMLFGVSGSYMGVTDHFIPNNDNTQDLGTGTYAWRNLYSHGANINGAVSISGMTTSSGAGLEFTAANPYIQFPAASTSPMIYMFKSGTTNAAKMVIAHSPSFSNYGLQYDDGTDTFSFVGSGANKLSIALGTGAVNVPGTLSKGAGTFKIDHPVDPENKFLYHSFVESPDMMNVYNGNITTEANGEAVVALPEYFESLNKDFRYQLTVIGDFAQAIVYKKIANNKFVIKTDKPNIEVSWQVTGIRKDPFAEKNRVVPEVMKSPDEKGKYLHPEAYGLPNEKGIGSKPNQ